ncbi:cobyrinate a,c-diamide synthase [Nocardioides sp. Iso805N]|uniref:cobyrinate a,c-diamide synthase n=1 Tax=Nocardioides sp. Iso805N TaxID=1283287 RepID=UPI00036B156F|nr:cobyrinate a,c-diamide synthase [Nocardioides sp. Iso805N]
MVTPIEPAELPRLVVAAPSTGQGKTTIATGLMAALRGSGLTVSGHKVGPDYIDPGYHALATGRPGRNLDPHLVGESLIAPLLLHGARVPVPADVAVIEGVMGLYDGRIGTDGFSSTAHVAALTRTPVVLVLDVARLSRSAGAIVAGMTTYDPSVRIAGVILNQAGSDRNVAEVVRSIRGVPVLGVVRRDERLATPSRHLGLVPAAERGASAETVALLGEQIAAQVDLAAVLEVARSAPGLEDVAWEPPVTSVVGAAGRRPRIAVAGGRAFTFRYAETEELLVAAGCEVVAFDPRVDAALPAGTNGLYLGGGFPEVYAADLAANRSLLADVRAAVAGGLPTVAECAGLLYLAESLDGTAMAGALPVRAAMGERLTLRYPVAEAAGDSLLTRVGERVTAHEFHKTVIALGSRHARPTWAAAWEVDGEQVGFAGPSLHASYLHVHWAGHPQLAQRFAQAAVGFDPWGSEPNVGGQSIAPQPAVLTPRGQNRPRADAQPLRHHGDAETRDGHLDFAVNVYAGARPGWLDDALSTSLGSIDCYPDPTPAAAALAVRHHRDPDEVLATAGAAEAFTLIARLRSWRRPVVVHPQFTEPHAALEQAGHRVDVVLCRAEDGFALHPEDVAEDADLVVVGNPTNPTGTLHPRDAVRALLRPGRVVVVDEAFMDAVPGEPASLARPSTPDGRSYEPGLLVLRSLTKHWSIPGIRAGYVLGDPILISDLAAQQAPWSVGTPAIAAMVACSTPAAHAESERRAVELRQWREYLVAGLVERGIAPVASRAPYVLASAGPGTHQALREQGVAVRRADTFPGLDASWIRIAVRPPHLTDHLFTALDRLPDSTVRPLEGAPT